ncbi:MAG: DUF2314 domain-containing protein [Rhizobiales bacterium]|nr:DUF2314 domain-containing protein [Hyphomicrobiales bacterium]
MTSHDVGAILPVHARFPDLLLTSLLLVSPVQAEEKIGDKVIKFDARDPEMNAAIMKAREALPGFWQKFAQPGPGENEFYLKVMIVEDGGSEHFWCGAIRGNAAAATCIIANKPMFVTSVKFGERVTVNPDNISDWKYNLNGKIKGGETIRVMIGRMPEEERAKYRELLVGGVEGYQK